MAKDNYVGGKICFESEKYFYEYCCDAVKFAVISAKLSKADTDKTLKKIDKVCKLRMKKLGFT